MHDFHKRDINYLRISVTDRCNLRCVYCMPPGGVKNLPHGEILTLEEIEEVVEVAAGAGIRKVRLTGGEPLVRKGITRIIASLAAMENIDDIAVTTNGVLLEQMGKDLKDSGLDRVNISLDTLSPERFQKITRVGKLDDVKKGIQTALDLGLHPVKINSVVIRGVNDDEILDMARLTLEYPLHVRFIELMPVGQSGPEATSKFVPSPEIMDRIEKGLGRLYPGGKPAGSGPAKYTYLSGARGTIGTISAISNHFCHECNRLRLTSTGGIRPCLMSDREVDIRTPLRNGASRQELESIFRRAVAMKPAGHNMAAGGGQEKGMSQIGG